MIYQTLESDRKDVCSYYYNDFEGGSIMIITSYNPCIITPRYDETVALFEALGFERRHMQENIDNQDIKSVRMKNEGGFIITVVHHVKKHN